MRVSLKVDSYLQAHEEFHHDRAKMGIPLVLSCTSSNLGHIIVQVGRG